MDTPEKNEIVLKDGGRWLCFRDPHHLIVAEQPADVPAALIEVERLVENRGWHAAGFLSYEAATAFDQALPFRPVSGFPYLWFGLYSQPVSSPLPKPDSSRPILDWQPTVDRGSYHAAVDRIRDYIAEGRTYQVNYTMRLQAGFDSSPWEFFLHLAQTQNRYAGYVDTGRFAVCSASPELFFELDGETITSRPMKGTANRGRTTGEDQAQADWLRNSEKNRAENVMIVDMVRNDLGRIAKPGSVRVPELFRVERYPTLWQMTSTVTAQTSASLVRIFEALFPCASITGAPKVSTIKIIHELEPDPRRIYTGAIGYLSPGRKASFNVAIRTALIDRQMKMAEYGIGGGIVWDSTSTDEYAEALLKARVLTEPLPQFSLLETMLWSPEDQYFLLDRHIGRLVDSAGYFGFPVSESQVRQQLFELSASFQGPQRVRLLSDRDGKLDISAVPLSVDEKPVYVRLANHPVDSADVYYFHKTTHRQGYDNVRSRFLGCDDVLLYNERSELTEFTIGNLVVELDQRLVTPPIECGLLAGTFRAQLLETGKITEQVIPLHRLKECKSIYRINSVRKWETVIIR